MPIYKVNKLTKLPRSRILENSAKRNGWRHKIFTIGGDFYKGQWLNDEKSGKGSYLGTKNLLYEGDFERNHRDGFGVLAREIKDLKVYELVYRGDWKNGKMHGHGLKIYSTGSYYVGYWKDGKRHGLGKMWYKNGNYYEGEWFDDKRHGVGMLVRADGNRYEGYWKDGLKDGKGIFLHLDSGQIQSGIWKKDSCVFSRIADLKFRQTALLPTKYPVLNNCLKYYDEMWQLQEERILNGLIEQCGVDIENNNNNNVMPAVVSQFEQTFYRDSIWSDTSLIEY